MTRLQAAFVSILLITFCCSIDCFGRKTANIQVRSSATLEIHPNELHYLPKCSLDIDCLKPGDVCVKGGRCYPLKEMHIYLAAYYQIYNDFDSEPTEEPNRGTNDGLVNGSV